MLKAALTCLFTLSPLAATEPLTKENLEQDEEPSSHTEGEAHRSIHRSRFATVAESQHGNSAKHQAPEHGRANVWLHRGEDQVKLHHLQRNSDGPIDVAIDNGGGADLDPELTHVEVVHGCNKGNQSTYVHRCLPVIAHSRRFHQEEHGRRNHRDGDDPEGDRNRIIWVEESFQVRWSCCQGRHSFQRRFKRVNDARVNSYSEPKLLE